VTEPLILRDQSLPEILIVVRLGAQTLRDEHLERSAAECHGRWGIWGFSVLEVPYGDYRRLARLRPVVARRRLLFLADGAGVVAAGFPLLPTLDHPHWRLTMSEVSTRQFERVRGVFQGPVENPAWAPPGRGIR
jgi:hypothetical protein